MLSPQHQSSSVVVAGPARTTSNYQRRRRPTRDWFLGLDDLSASLVRDAVEVPAERGPLLVAGDKAGQWTRWYGGAIKLAEDRCERYLATPPVHTGRQ